ncbi:15393_t:CDS:1, partial [Acaulospora morrowiae]
MLRSTVRIGAFKRIADSLLPVRSQQSIITSYMLRPLLITHNFSNFASTRNSSNSSIPKTAIPSNAEELASYIPAEILMHTKNPQPVRHEITESKEPLKAADLENLDIKIKLHRTP